MRHLGLALGVLLAASVSAKEAETAPEAAIREAVGALLKLEWKDGGLALDRKHWDEPFQGKTPEQFREERKAELLEEGIPPNMIERMLSRDEGRSPAQQLFEQIQRAASLGMGGGSGRSGGGDRVQMTFEAQMASGVLAIQKKEFALSLTPHRAGVATLDFHEDGRGGLRLILMTEEGLAVLQQASEGRFRAAHFGTKGEFAGSGANFLEFYRKHREFVDRDLFPLLAGAGIRIPFTPSHPRVLQAALARLCPPEAERAHALILQLDDDAFDRREAATKALSDGYLRWKALITAAAADPKTTPEAGTRLKQVLDQHGGDDGALAFLESMKLLEDPEFLVSVLKAAAEPDRKAVVSALAGIAGKDLGVDPAAWEGWLAKREPGDRINP